MKVRQSNMELLRITAMFLVLLVHADFFSLGAPSAPDCVNAPIDSSLRVLFEAISKTCVDIFVCLSGWFGIRPSIRSFSNFVFQCLFWLIGLYVVTLLLGTSSISIQGLMGCFALTKLNWFIKAYILLYILSPVLNAFVEKVPRKEFKNVLIAFFTFEFIYGWLFSGSTQHIQSGLSTISFIGLYLLARYVRIYQPRISMKSKRFYITSLSIAPLCLTMAYITPPQLGIKTTVLGGFWISYVSPYCIAFSIFMILLFSKFQIQSKLINWVAASSFAVFLIHTNPNTLWHFKDLFVGLYKKTNCIEFWLYTFGILIAIFITAVVIDQVRIWVWKLLWNKLEKYNNDSNNRQS